MEKAQKGDTPRMRRLFASIPEDVYKALKYRAVEQDIDMQDVVTEALRKHLGLKGGEKGGKSK